MIKFNTTYKIKYQRTDNPYPSIWNGSYRYVDKAMKKVEELKKDPKITLIVLKKCNGHHFDTLYKYDEGFEIVYLKN